MGYKPKPWPHRALWALEDTLAGLADIEKLADDVQRAAQEGNALLVVVTAADIRKRAALATVALVRARAGDYGQASE